MSDMAPNMSGIAGVDQPQSMYLVELALEMACAVPKARGNVGRQSLSRRGFRRIYAPDPNHFQKVLIWKPKASRPWSREVYPVAKDFTGST